MAIKPPPRGGRAVPVKMPRPPAPPVRNRTPPRAARPVVARPAAPVQDPATSAAMQTFRSTLAQLNSLSPAVDATAIRAPYEASKVATGQLGAGWNASELASGQAAQDQYNRARDAAQQSATSFGISAGAGAAPTAIDDSGNNLLLSQQTQANASAALSAAAAWQGLLERTAGAAVSKAQQARQDQMTAGQQQLTMALPGLIGDEKNLAFQKKTESDNMRALYSQLSEKQRAAISGEQLRAMGIEQTAGAAAARTAATRRGQDKTAAAAASKLAETQRHNLKTEAATAAKQKAAKAAGIKGIDQVMKLNPKSGAAKGVPTAAGFTATIQQYDAAGKPLGPPEHGVHLSDARPGHTGLKAGWRVVGTPEPNTVTRSSGAGSTGFNWPVYRQQLAILVGMNPGVPVAQLKSYLPPTPKTAKKKK